MNLLLHIWQKGSCHPLKVVFVAWIHKGPQMAKTATQVNQAQTIQALQGLCASAGAANDAGDLNSSLVLSQKCCCSQIIVTCLSTGTTHEHDVPEFGWLKKFNCPEVL